MRPFPDSNPSNQGMIGARPTPQETAMQRVNSAVTQLHARLHSLCNRVEAFADRMEPQPSPTVGPDNVKPSSTNDINGLHRRLSELSESIDWLDRIAERLDHIA